MVKASCGCEFEFSLDNIVEFTSVCEKHVEMMIDFGQLLKEVTVAAAHWMYPRRKLIGAWKYTNDNLRI